MFLKKCDDSWTVYLHFGQWCWWYPTIMEFRCCVIYWNLEGFCLYSNSIIL